MSLLSFFSSWWTATDEGTSDELVSKWYRGDKTHELVTFGGKLKKGDIVQIKLKNLSYLWAVCTRDGHEPKLAYRIGRDDFSFIPAEIRQKKGFVYEIGLNELHERNRSGFLNQFFGDSFAANNLNSSALYSTSANIQNRICYHIRINNSRDNITTPKSGEDVVSCALAIVGTMGDDQFGPYHLNCNNDIDFVEHIRYSKDTLDNRLDEHGCSPWHTKEKLESFSWLLRPGDLVEFNRKNIYSHWAVAIDRPLDSEGCEPLVHRYGSGDASELVKKLIGKIMKSTFQEVIKGSRFRINNSRDKIYTALDSADIRQFAIDSLYSNAFGTYNLATNNCRHFVMQARYRVKVPKNTELLTAWYRSVADIRSLLTTGDIIEFGDRLADSPDQYQELAIYVETIKSAGLISSNVPTVKTPKVAYLSRSEEPNERPVVLLTSVEDFFMGIARDKDFRINNKRDYMWKPKDCEDIVKYIAGINSQEDPYFVIGARYGRKVREEVERIGGGLSKALAGIKMPWYMGLAI